MYERLAQGWYVRYCTPCSEKLANYFFTVTSNIANKFPSDLVSCLSEEYLTMWNKKYAPHLTCVQKPYKVQLETKASSHEGQCIPAGSSVSPPKRVLTTVSIITMRSISR